MRKFIVNPYQYSLGNHNPIKTPGGVSMTVPGQTLGLKELLQRYVRGQSVQVFQGVYEEDPALDGLERLDKVERQEAIVQNKRNIANIQRVLAEQAEAQKAQPVPVPPKEKDDAPEQV